MSAELDEKVVVIGLGYVGLPVAVAFAAIATETIGFDIDTSRVMELASGHDRTGEIPSEQLAASSLHVTAVPGDLAGGTFFIVTVPTPVDAEKRPDFKPLLSACRTIGQVLRPGAVVVFESTVYPGATEEVCGPALEAASDLVCGRDFVLGYSPERINPGDTAHRLQTIVKVVAGQDASTLARVSAAYAKITEAGVFEANSIRVAEAAKVIENTQRDVNIALMNELALIFDRLGLRTADVLAAARTKWNFLPFTPGLVGGHCIGVDPYYLTAKAEAVGHHPEVILSGRRINDTMGRFVAQRTLKLIAREGGDLGRARIGLLGVTFKEDVPDMRNSQSPSLVDELAQFGMQILVHDAVADAREVARECSLTLEDLSAFEDLDALILAVKHRAYLDDPSRLWSMLRPGGVFIDVKSVFQPADLPAGLRYWSL